MTKTAAIWFTRDQWKLIEQLLTEHRDKGLGTKGHRQLTEQTLSRVSHAISSRDKFDCWEEQR